MKLKKKNNMILDEFVEMRWNRSNKEYYINKGYHFTKMREIFTVSISDLCKNSKVEIHVNCDICGCNVLREYCKYLINVNNMNYFSCSKFCSLNKVKKTNLKKYGVEYPLQNREVNDKLKQTNLEKYGVINVFQNKQIKEKSKLTNLEKYGVEYVQQNKQIKEKSKLTNLEKYGVENYNNLEKRKQTNLNKYGVECVFQNEKIKEKSRETNLSKYGTESVSQNEEIKEKKRTTCIENYGEVYFKYSPKININSIVYLEKLSEKLNLRIQHGLNGGEKKFIRYSIDGYIEEYNICIEWDEKYHSGKKQKESDLKKDKFLKENFGCYIIRINEKEFIKNINHQVNLISEKIKRIINNKRKTIEQFSYVI